MTVKNCAIDATVTIKGVSLDDETFDKSYIVINGIYDLSSEECNVRLGVQNLERIAEDLGDNETTWTGQKIVCIGTQTYPGLGTRGLLWRGVKPGQKEPARAPVAAVDVDGIINKILANKPDMTRNAVMKLIEEEKAKAGGLLTDEAAVHLVASNLGVK
ncbi:unnamed protein product [marine sediment metagenome]|uniref:Uncharacterized protein n=1 Tax=marine sediment metagenome TaxID=412755 RepID=X1J1B4_9ZZZZ